MSGPTWNKITYRLWRLRRLIVLATALPVPALAWAISAGAPLGWSFLAAWALVVILLVEVFPNAWVETLAMGLTVALGLLPVPFVAANMPTLRPEQNIAWLFVPIALVLLWTGLTLAIWHLNRVPSPLRRLHHRCRLPLDPATARDALFLRPGATVGPYRCGPAGPDGTFDVEFLAFPFEAPLDDPRPFQAAPERPIAGFDGSATPFRAHVKVVSTSANRQETITMVKIDDHAPAAFSEIEVLTPIPGGTLYEKTEFAGDWSLVNSAGYWLKDFEADTITHVVDNALGRPSRANRAATGETPLSLIARLIVLVQGPEPRL